MRVNSGATRRNIGGQRKVRNPQVLDVDIAKRVPDRLVKVLAGEHRRYRVREIQQLASPVGHFLGGVANKQLKQETIKLISPLHPLTTPPHLTPLPGLLRHRRYILLRTEERAHKCPDRHPAHHIDRNASLLDRLQHSHVRRSPGPAAAQHQAHRVARQPPRQAREIGMYIRLGH